MTVTNSLSSTAGKPRENIISSHNIGIDCTRQKERTKTVFHLRLLLHPSVAFSRHFILDFLFSGKIEKRIFIIFRKILETGKRKYIFFYFPGNWKSEKNGEKNFTHLA